MGVGFNYRRQSRDRVVTARILELASGHRLVVKPYTAKLFTSGGVTVTDDLTKAKRGDFVFVEKEDAAKYMKKADRLIVFRWNRDYPSDVYCTVDFSALTLESTREFGGFSHECVAEEVWVK